jgi:hypothetical protein
VTCAWRCDERSADLGGGIWYALGLQALIDWRPRCACIITAECACGGDGDEDAIRALGVEDDRVQAHSAPARVPRRTGAMGAESGKFLPVLPAIGGAE